MLNTFGIEKSRVGNCLVIRWFLIPSNSRELESQYKISKMSKNKKRASKIKVDGTEIRIRVQNGEDYISLTDMVSGFEGAGTLIERWIRNKNTLEFLGIWEQLNNPNFNSLEFEGIYNEAGLNRFYLSIKKWVNKTNAIGLESRVGRYGGSYAHEDIALEFATYLSPKFKMYFINEFKRLKTEEAKRENLEWTVKRTLAKVNYFLHENAIREYLIPPEIKDTNKEYIVFASEGDLLNIALFGMTASDWRQENPEAKGNIRDHASYDQLLVLANIENLNARYIQMGLEKEERLQILNEDAREQMKLLAGSKAVQSLIDEHGESETKAISPDKKEE